jgi:hypothetical protein
MKKIQSKMNKLKNIIHYKLQLKTKKSLTKKDIKKTKKRIESKRPITTRTVAHFSRYEREIKGKKERLTSDKLVTASKHAPPIKKDKTKRNQMILRKNILHHWKTSHSSPEIHGIFHILPHVQHVLVAFSISKILIK